MKRQHIFGLLAVGLIFSSSCKKDNGTLPVNPKLPWDAQTGVIEQWQDQEIEQRKQSFYVDAGSFSIEGNAGTQLSGQDAFIYSDGTLATGLIEIELVEIYDKASMILCGKPTVAKNNGTYDMLVSGGEMFISAKQNSQGIGKEPSGVIASAHAGRQHFLFPFEWDASI